MKRILFLSLAMACGACSGGAENTSSPTPVALVRLATAQQGALAKEVTLYGVAEAGASGTQTLTAPAEAWVARVVAPVGTAVKKGDIVVQLAAGPTTRLDIAKASADARAADAAYARAQRLRADGLVGNAEVDTARAAAAGANATQASLNGRASALTLRAPVAGVVETIAVPTGTLVQPGAAVATIAKPGDLRGRFGADPTVARALSPGAPIRIEGTAGRPPFTVPITSVTPLVDPQTRLASVFAQLPAAARLGVGEILTGTVAVGTSGSAVTIPYSALLDDGGQPYVFVVANGVAHRRDVSVGPTEGGRVAIAKGVHAGEQVVTEGGTAVEDGMKVRTR